MQLLKLTIAIFLFLMLQPSANAQEEPVSNDPPYPCPYENGAFYRAGVFPRYDVASKSLVLSNTSNEIVLTIEPIENNLRIIDWSPDCRYLTGAVGELRNPTGNYASWYSKDIVIWDTTTGSRVHTFENNRGYYLATSVHAVVIWHPDSAYALVLGGCYSVHNTCAYERHRQDFIWSRDMNQSYRVGQIADDQWYPGSRSYFNQYYWDMTRGWLWGSGIGGVSAYDITTGAEVRFFQTTVRPTRNEARFNFSTDGAYVVVYSISPNGLMNGGGISVHHIETGNAIHVNAEGFGAPEIPFAPYHPVSLSADNRYLIAGYTAIRVWDIQNLPESFEDRLPIYRHGGPEARIHSLKFVDWGVIETSSDEGVQRWDLHTGAYIPDTP